MKTKLLTTPITMLPLSAHPQFVNVATLEGLRVAALMDSNRTKTSHLRSLDSEIQEAKQADDSFSLFHTYYFSRALNTRAEVHEASDAGLLPCWAVLSDF